MQYSRRSNGIRKTHRKSRNGCLQCKKRHIKCDEQRPICGDCQRLETACSLSADASGSASPGASSPASTTTTAAQAPPTPVTPAACVVTNVEDAAVSLLDLELLYHYINSTVQTFIADDAKKMIHFSRHEFIEVGFRYPFVMHSMLACSALHMFSKDRSNAALFSKATTLQGMALRGVQPYVSNLQAEHAIPAFIFSNFTGMFTFAELVLSAEPPLDAIEDMLSCFKILRGAQTIVLPFMDYLTSTWLRPALVFDEYLSNDLSTDERVPTQDRINELIDASEPALRSVLQSAADRLFRFIALFMGTPVSATSAPSPYVQAWPVWIDIGVIELFERRDPVGLVLLAHYCGLMALRPEIWWRKGWHVQLFASIEHALDGRHADLLQWPRKIIHDSVR